MHRARTTVRYEWGIDEAWRYYEREDAFCEDCAAIHVAEFEKQGWVQQNEGRFPVRSSCPTCSRPLMLCGSKYGLYCNCNTKAKPDDGQPRHLAGFSWVEFTCGRCGKRWLPAIPHRPLRVAGSEGVPCSERCRKAIYRRANQSTPAERTCAICGESFTPKRSDARYCSNACRQDAYRKRKLGATS